MRIFSIIYLLFIHINYSYSKNNDTIIVINYKFKEIKSSSLIYYEMRNDTIYLLKKKVNSKGTKKADSILSKEPYCKFYDSNFNLIEECVWFGEGFNGYYKSYFINGNIRKSGKYINNIKIGEWVFYNRKGKIIKIENYNNEGELISIKKP